MRNPRLTCLVNRRPSNWLPDWPFFVLDGSRVPHEETSTEEAIRELLALEGGHYHHIMPLLLALDRREWSRHITPAEDDYKPEWKTYSGASWTYATFRALGGKSVFPLVQAKLPLAASAEFERVPEGLAMTAGSYPAEILPASFLGATASVTSPKLYGRIILDSGEWDINGGAQASVTFSPSSYPWKFASDTLSALPGIETFLLEAGTLPQWAVSHSPMDKVTCVTAGLILKGLRS